MFNTQLGFAYINHWLNVVDEHSLQAPFIFSLYRDVIKTDSVNEKHLAIEKIREGLLTNSAEINIIDLGAGSKYSKAKKRTIASVAKSALSSAKFCRLIARMVVYHKPQTIIELGTSLGITTCYLASATESGRVYTFEGCRETAEVAKTTFESRSINNATLLNGNIDEQLPTILAGLETVDFAYFDANHTYAATMHYFEMLNAKATQDSIFVLDDIHWSADMSKAWKEIISLEQVTLSIDLLEVGIVFFKNLGQKQHYLLDF